MILALCERWHCPPSAVLAEPGSSLRYVLIAGLGNSPEGGDA